MGFELARYIPRDTPRDTVDEIDKYSSSTVIGYYKFVKAGRQKRQIFAEDSGRKRQIRAKRKLDFQTAHLPGPNSPDIPSYMSA